jgi:hypothetical protein
MIIEEPLPGLAVSKYSQRIDEIVEWFASKEILVSQTRIQRYKRFLDYFKKNNDFIVKNDEDIKILEELLFTLREVHELMWIKKGVDVTEPKGIDHLLKIIAGGNSFAKDDKNTTARNYQFELRIASYFLQNGYKVDLSSLTDVIAKSGNTSFYLECKRLHSEKKVSTRIKEASNQLKFRVSKQSILSKKYGIAVFDVTRIAFLEHEVLYNLTHDQCRNLLRKKLSDIMKSYDFIRPFQNNKKVIAVWIQIFIPSLAESNKRSEGSNKPSFIQPNTRFSSHFTILGPINGSRGKALEQLKNATEIYETRP